MADEDVVKVLRREREKLQADLERTPAYKRLLAIDVVLAAYESADSVEPVAPMPRAAIAKPRQMTPTVKSGTKTAKIMEIVVDYLTTKKARATSGEILKVVRENGVEIGGKVPSATMASYLSNAKMLDNVAGQGYGLKEWSQKGKDQREMMLAG